MTIIPLTECCAMLGIDPKTLRHWLNHAQVPVAAHPTDARIKGVSLEHVEQLATLHGRWHLAPPSASAGLPEGAPGLAWSEQPASGRAQREAAPAPASHLVPGCLPQEAELIQKVVGLETDVSRMQQQLTQLALDLLHERDLRYERRLAALEARVPQTGVHPAEPFPIQTSAGQTTRQHEAPNLRPLHPAPNRRSRLLPLIEYGASGRYVVICPQLGELALTPESPEWFAWLASLSSFRFVGKLGYFTACHTFKKGPTRFWQAYRTIHQHRYKPYLGGTELLTIACLEQTAATLQSYVDRR